MPRWGTTAADPQYPGMNAVGMGTGLRVSKLEARIMDSGLTKEVIAQSIGVTSPRLCQWANGTRPIPTKRIVPLCTVLRCRPQELLGWEEIG